MSQESDKTELNREQAISLFDGNEGELERRFAEVAWQKPHAVSLVVEGRLALLTRLDQDRFVLEKSSALSGLKR